MRLSKSKYTKLWQCPKILWLKQYKPEEETPLDEGTLARMSAGSDVGDLAMGLFGDFIEVTAYKYDKNGDKAGLDYGVMLTRTKEEMRKGTPVICEASFSKGGNFCSVDILKKEAGGWAIYEVKSSAEIKPEYAADVAYQKYVLEMCGVNVTGTYLVTINRDYRLDGELDVQGLFKITDISEDVAEEIKDVEPIIDAARKMMVLDKEPEIECGMQCFRPYVCQFKGYCMSDLPIPSAFDLYSIRKTKALDYYHRGMADFRSIYESGEITNETHLRQMEHYLNEDMPAHIDREGLQRFIDTVTYPLYFLDFETMTPIVPVYQGTKSRQQIPFQYSLHYIEEKGGELKHKEFLAESGPDPRRTLAKALCRDIPMGVCTMVYNKSMESDRIKELAEIFPDLAEHLLDIDKGIVDLVVPFRQGCYYNRNMTPPPEGVSLYSIKNVLPSVFPDDPELDYHNLEGVHNGGEAMTIFPQIQYMDPAEQEKTRHSLLKYCELDTYAMVKLWLEMERLVEE